LAEVPGTAIEGTLPAFAAEGFLTVGIDEAFNEGFAGFEAGSVVNDTAGVKSRGAAVSSLQALASSRTKRVMRSNGLLMGQS